MCVCVCVSERDRGKRLARGDVLVVTIVSVTKLIMRNYFPLFIVNLPIIIFFNTTDTPHHLHGMCVNLVLCTVVACPLLHFVL